MSRGNCANAQISRMVATSRVLLERSLRHVHDHVVVSRCVCLSACLCFGCKRTCRSSASSALLHTRVRHHHVGCGTSVLEGDCKLSATWEVCTSVFNGIAHGAPPHKRFWSCIAMYQPKIQFTKHDQPNQHTINASSTLHKS